MQIFAWLQRFSKKEKTIGLFAFCVLMISLSLCFCRHKSDIQPAGAQLSEVVNIIRNNFRTRPDYWQLSNAWLISQNILPSKMIQDNAIINLLDKPVFIGSGMSGQVLMPGAKSFDVAYQNLSYDECVGLSGYEFLQNEVLGLISITIINGAEENKYTWGDGGLPLSPQTAQKICRDKNILIWNFE